MADDLHIVNAQFLDRGWIVTELPDPQVVMDVRHGLEAKLRALVHNEAATLDRKSTRLNSSHIQKSRMPSSA